MSTLPPNLDQAFQMTAAELGMCSAARLFVSELDSIGGDALVHEARDRIGRAYPVFDFVANARLSGKREKAIDPTAVCSLLAGVTQLVVVGLEAYFLDALVDALPDVAIGLVTQGAGLELDERRVLANYAGRVASVPITEVQRWSGRRSALLTFVYGGNEHVAYVSPPWVRVSGPDVRTSFRTVVGWDIFGDGMLVYPRWLLEIERATFSHMVGP